MINNSIESSGVIPLSRDREGWKVFLIQYKGYEQFWGCPKGHLNADETHEEAASRELKEETGLEIKRFLSNEPILEEFYWVRKGERLLKRVLFYVAEVEGEISLQNEEIVDGKWFSLPEAIDKVIHSEGKETLKQVNNLLSFIKL